MRAAQWGGAIRFDTGDDAYLGWIWAELKHADERAIEVLADDPQHRVYLQEMRRRETPYSIRVIELDRRVHEAGGYEQGSDYRRNETFWFRTAEEAGDWLQEKYSISLEDLVDPREVDVP